MFGRRFSEGLHQAIEAKEGVEIKKESRTMATITFQNYFRLYKKLAGMTGTAATEAEEFAKIYELEVVVVPTNKPMIRKDLTDSISYFGSASSELIAKDFIREERRNFTIRKEILWESCNAENSEVNQKEIEYIRKYNSNNPNIEYNQWPKYGNE